jgi:hypothetical protein
MLGADVVTVKVPGRSLRQLQRGPGICSKRDLGIGGMRTSTDDLLDLVTDRFQRNTEASKGLGRHTLALVKETEQEVLGADAVMVEHPGLLLGQDHDAQCAIGQPLGHRILIHGHLRPQYHGRTA